MATIISIGRFSELSGLSLKTIRLYGNLGLLPPARVDAFTGYRYYDPGQVVRARTIARLRGAGISLREIAAFLEHPEAGQIDEWEKQLDAETSRRRENLDAVRRTLAGASEAAEEVAMVSEDDHGHSHEHGPRHFLGVAPVLHVEDVAAAAEYYRDKLGFEIRFLMGEPPLYATTARGDAAIHFSKSEQTVGHASTVGDIYLFVSDVDGLYQELTARDVKVVADLETFPYGMREFSIEDLNGYRLCFGESVEEK